MSVLACKGIVPVLLSLLGRLPVWVAGGTCALFCALLVMDLIAAVLSWNKLNAQLEALRLAAFERTNKNMEQLSDALAEKSPIQIEALNNGLHVWADNWTLFIRKAELRFLNAIPDILIPRFEPLMHWLKIKRYMAGIFGYEQKAVENIREEDALENTVHITTAATDQDA